MVVSARSNLPPPLTRKVRGVAKVVLELRQARVGIRRIEQQEGVGSAVAFVSVDSRRTGIRPSAMAASGM